MSSLSQLYRPRRFAEVTGQAHVTETLRLAVAGELLAHAFIFSGPRGVGKTTTARILAQALHCIAPVDGEPCRTCKPCLTFVAGRSMDVMEIDAATHTGVDNVRQSIIEHARFAPVGKAKIYILDEAHMLSSAAWNALLKTLEEPPSYAYFIFATTEWHKIPATILSRCQRYAFRRVSNAVLSERLLEIALKQAWTLTPEAVRLIVSHADGCVRDAETMLGQLALLDHGPIDTARVALVLPTGDMGSVVELLQTWRTNALSQSFELLATLADEGREPLMLFDTGLEMIRQLLRAQGLPSVKEQLEQGAVFEKTMARLAANLSPIFLHDLALTLVERRRDVKLGFDGWYALELLSAWAISRLLHDSTVSVVCEPGQPQMVATPSAPIAAPSHQVDLETTILDLSQIRIKWPEIVRIIGTQNHSLPFILNISQPTSVAGTVLTIRFQYAFHRDKILQDIKHRRLVEDCLREALQCPTLTIDGVVQEDQATDGSPSQDMVANILKAFGGTVVEG